MKIANALLLFGIFCIGVGLLSKLPLAVTVWVVPIWGGLVATIAWRMLED